eukprot:CAMPEP_0170565090 /NCGR_PEP_ID=MMETSP0211-20121228/76638_1 /TAXON_ID=311385 /ORGANISM="Pseudokeronopsis sp., Strain OXSARD2" /LENGTH=66 /DNA_ID=CAMNT_0010885401 /DNA_START=625 /DNA_END=822 /DNA_ORIENTATION=-
MKKKAKEEKKKLISRQHKGSKKTIGKRQSAQKNLVKVEMDDEDREEKNDGRPVFYIYGDPKLEKLS